MASPLLNVSGALKRNGTRVESKALIERFWTPEGRELMSWRDHICIGYIAPTEILGDVTYANIVLNGKYQLVDDATFNVSLHG